MEQGYWNRAASNRVTRRRAIGIGATASMGLAGLALVGCSSDDEDDSSTGVTPPVGGGTQTPGATTSPDPDGPHYGGELLTNIGDDPVSFDGQIESSNVTQSAGVGYAYNGLLRTKSDFSEILPALAHDWEQLDELTLVFHLRENVHFHNLPPVNGRLMTSEDVVYSMERLRTPSPEFAHAYMVEDVDTFEAPDPNTFVINLSRPFAPLIQYLAGPYPIVVPQEAVEEFGDLRQNIIGTGPYVLVQANRSETYRLERNNNYFDPERPYFDSIRSDVVPDKASRMAALLGGANHVEARGVNSDDAAQFSGDDRWVVQSAPIGAVAQIYYNTQTGPFVDQRLRKAMDLAYDRYEYIDLAAGGAALITGPVSSGLPPFAIPPSELAAYPGYREDKTEDLTEARRLLDAVGYDVFRPKVMYRYSSGGFAQPTMLAAQAQLLASSVGIEIVELEELDNANWTPRMLAGEYEVSAADQAFSDNVDRYLYGFVHTNGARNYPQFSNDEIDRLIEQTQSLSDPDERLAVIHEVQIKLIEEHVPTSWLFAGDYFEIWTSRLKNYDISLPFDRARQIVHSWFDA